MNPIALTILKLLTAVPGEFAALASLWTLVKSGLSGKDQAAVDAVIAALDAKTDADVAAFVQEAAQ